MSRYYGLRFIDLLLYLPSKFQRVANCYKRLCRPTCPAHNDRAVAQHSSKQTLIDTDTLNLVEEQFYRFALDNARFHDDPFVCYGELC